MSAIEALSPSKIDSTSFLFSLILLAKYCPEENELNGSFPSNLDFNLDELGFLMISTGTFPEPYEVYGL